MRDENMGTPMQQQAVPAFAIFDDYRPTVTITMLIRWLLLAAWLAMTNYRQEHDSDWVVFNLLGAALGVANAYLTWRIVTGRPITWHHALGLSVLDLAVITAGLYIFGGFQNRFYVFYYPALLGFSLMFPRWASFSVLAAVIVLYVVMALMVSPTLSVAAYQEKVLFVRVITMVGIVAAGTLLVGWERARRREAVASERRQAEEHLEQMLQSEQLSVIGRMAASIIHDLKKPMAVIRGFAELLANPNVDAEKRQTFSNLIMEDVDRFLGMTQELLDYSRGQINLEFREVHLGEWVETVGLFWERNSPLPRWSWCMTCNTGDRCAWIRTGCAGSWSTSPGMQWMPWQVAVHSPSQPGSPACFGSWRWRTPAAVYPKS